MNRIGSRWPIAALGIGLAMAIAAGAQVSVAQPGPRPLPANPQTQDRAPDRQDQQYGRRDDRRDGGQPRREGPAPGRRWSGTTPRLSSFAIADHPGAGTGVGYVRQCAARGSARPPWRHRSGEHDRFRAPSVVERLEKRQRMLADRSADLDRVVRALRPLYASFSEDQRRTADRLMFMPGESRRGPDGRRFEDRGRGGPGFDRDRDPDRGGYPDYRR
jgi:hypothetical protein